MGLGLGLGLGLGFEVSPRPERRGMSRRSSVATGVVVKLVRLSSRRSRA